MLAIPARHRTLAILLPTILAAAALLTACGGAGGPTADGDGAAVPEPAIENPALAIALEGISTSGFELVANDGATLRLRRPARGGEAEATVDYGAGEPQVAGVNLVDAVKAQKAEIEARADGEFFGQLELMSQFGTAYTTRGRYTGEDGEEVEEVRTFCVHPAGDRLLWATYRYPPKAGETETRREQAMAALGLVVPLAPAAEPEGGDAAEEPSGGSTDSR